MVLHVLLMATVGVHFLPLVQVQSSRIHFLPDRSLSFSHHPTYHMFLSPLHHKRRQLITQRFSSSGRHQHKCVISCQYIFDDCSLISFKGIKTKMFFELFCQIILLRHTIHNFKNRRSGHLQTVYVRFFKLFLRILQRDMECLFICRRHTVHGIHHHSLHNGT